MNFNDHWIEACRTGLHADDQGRSWPIDDKFLDLVIANFAPAIHEPPAVIGHPKTDAPAYGWVKAIRKNGDRLEVRFKDLDPQFEQIVREGRYRKRSASFYLDREKGPMLKHVGFLGATPPAVKGLRDIKFAEGESITLEFSEGEESMDEAQVNSLMDRLIDRLKSIFPGKKDEPPATVSFSEADRQRLIDDAVRKTTETLTVSFSEQLKERDDRIKALTDRVASQAATTTRDQIIAFCEKLGADKCPQAFREMGVVEFMESLAPDRQVTVISFAEENGQQVKKETKLNQLDWFKGFLSNLGPFIQFGEQFGSLKFAQGAQDVATITDPNRMNNLRQQMGLQVTGDKRQ